MNQTDKAEMQIEESQDGGATVTLPEVESDSSAEKSVVTEDSNENSSENESNQVENTELEEQDEDREAIRAARREERKLKKQIHREKARESNHLISALKKQNSELSERLASLERKTSGAELARVDKAKIGRAHV